MPKTEAMTAKIRKLLALADSSNEHEAALAAEKAQELMLRHGIEMAQVAAATPGRTVVVGDVVMYGDLDPWRRTLMSEIASSLGGDIIWTFSRYRRSRGQAWWYGPTGTVESMVDLYRYLETTLVSLSATATATRADTSVHPRTFRTSYLAGMVARIGERLQARARVVSGEGGNSKALVLVRDAVQKRVDEVYGKVRADGGRCGVTDVFAYLDGAAAGARVSFGDHEIVRSRGELPA